MPTSIRLSPEIEECLNCLVKETGRTKAFYLREIIEQGITDIEDYYKASKVLERVRSGKEKVCSSEEIRKKFGVDD